MERLGEKGNIVIEESLCNKDVGLHGLEPMLGESDEWSKLGRAQEYLDMTGRHRIDMQINIETFGKELPNGIANTKEMAKKWNWHSDSDELNWRNKPCALRISYDQEKKIFKVHVWNNLAQLWINLALTKEELEKIMQLDKHSYPVHDSQSLLCDKIESKETEHGIEWEYFKDGKIIDTAFMTYKELYLILADKREHKCQFCDSLETERYRPRGEDNAINLCQQHAKYIQRLSHQIYPDDTNKV